MRRSTVADAVRAFQRLRSVNAGSLVGVALADRYRTSPPLKVDTLPPAQAAVLGASIEARTAGVIDGETPAYLVYSGDLPVAWCTVRATVVTPDLVLDGTPARHQRMAVQAMSDLARWVLVALADARPESEDTVVQSVMSQEGAVRIAPADDLTSSAAVLLDGDLTAAQSSIAKVLPVNAAAEVVVLDAHGFGRYGRDSHRLPLPVLCAMRRIASTHQLPLAAVGDWLAASGGVDADVPAEDLPAIFTADFVGLFPHRSGYAEKHLVDRGWATGLERLGMPRRYIDLEALERDLFDNDVHAVATTDATGGQAVAVVRRPVLSWPETPTSTSTPARMPARASTKGRHP
ncbi:hypothetical protein AB0869_15545 [Micromonospora vinacea]|uniref:hypothetical protein n=1 Tax=Micromonospora vinacea TaxID=709878 RepID=UPI003453F2B2